MQETRRPNPYERLMRQLGKQRWFAWFGQKILTPADRLLHGRRRTLTTLGTSFPLCYLTTTGRKSGEPRRVPLLYLDDGDAAIVVGTNFGTEHHPGWVYNLETDPSALLETERGTDRPVNARRADHAEWARYWPRFAEIWPAYDTYLDRTTRDVRMFVLEPAD